MESKPSIAGEDWTLVVGPKTSWFKLELKELWKCRDLISVFAKRDIISVYRQTLLGPLWLILQPILVTLIFVVVFQQIVKLPTDGTSGPLFYLSGITLWNYFSTSFAKISNTFVTNAPLFGKVYFPRLAIPVSTLLSTLVTFVIQFMFFFILLLYFTLVKGTEMKINSAILLLPVLLVIVAGISFGTGIIISSLTAKYRDLSYVIPFATQLLMFVTPIIYPLSLLEGKKRIFLLANPMTSLIETFRYSLLGAGQFNWVYLAYSAFFMVVVLFIGIILFNRTEKNFMDTV
jgi:lipopolysaccharide transport system permease protein